MCMASFHCPKCDTAYWGFPFFRCECGYAFLSTVDEMGLDENTIFVDNDYPAIPQEIADYWQKHIADYDGKALTANVGNEIWQKICEEKRCDRYLADIETERVCAEATMRTLEKYGTVGDNGI